MFLLMFFLSFAEGATLKAPAIETVCAPKMFLNPADVATLILTDDKIFMTVLLEGRIFVFDKEGNRLPDIGKGGSGPGEFMYPMAMTYHQQHLYVMDNGRAKLSKIDPATGQFVQSWLTERANKIMIHDQTLYAAFNMALKPTIGMFGYASLKKELAFDRAFFFYPCCLEIKGSKSGGMAVDPNGNRWFAYTGEYRLEKYNQAGKLVKKIAKEPNDFVGPTKSKASRFDRKAMKKHYVSFDKVGGVFILDDMVVLYRYKEMDNARLDFYTLQGEPLAYGVDVSGISIAGVYQGLLYGYRITEAYEDADLEIVTLDFRG